jgi:hypothetical protein
MSKRKKTPGACIINNKSKERERERERERDY